MKYTKRIKFFVGVQIAFLLLVFPAYKIFSRQFIRIAYDLQFKPIKSFSDYLFRVNDLFSTCYLYGVLIILCELVFFLKIKKISTKIIFIILSFGMLIFAGRYNYLVHHLSNYKYFVDAYPKIGPLYPELSEDQIINLGWANRKANKYPKSSYLAHSKNKSNNVMRIGIFGSSPEVTGSEIGNYDYPSLLQNKFNEAGMKNVEIINFSVYGYGAFQDYMMWQFLGKYYDLDYVVFVFAHTQGWDASFKQQVSTFGPLHARYILEDDKLKLLPVVGNSRYDACNIYHRVIPPFRYIYYDIRIPMFFRVLLPTSFHSRMNPFYYKWRSPLQKELYPIYAALFNNLSKETKNLIIIAERSSIDILQKNVKSPNVYFFEPQVKKQLKSFLYRIPYLWYFNLLANQELADELFYLFMGYSEMRFKNIELSCVLAHADAGPNLSSLSLSKYRNVSLNSGKHPVADFRIGRAKLFYQKFAVSLKFKDSNISSLLMLPVTNLGTIIFIPLSFSLKDNEDIFLSCKKGRELIKIPIGKVKAPAGVIGIIDIKSDYNKMFKDDGFDWKLDIENFNALTQNNAGVNSFSIVLGDKKILTEKKTARSLPFFAIRNIFTHKKSSFIEMEPVEYEFASLVSKLGYFINISPFNDKGGNLDLVLTDNNGHEQRYPVFSYKFISMETTPLKNPYRQFILSTGQKWKKP